MEPQIFTMFVVEEDGRNRLKLSAPKRYEEFVKRLGLGQELRCVLSDPVRDLKHNNKFHGVCHEVADALGWETAEFKEYILPILRPAGECPITGKVLRQKTHAMTNDEIDQLVLEIKAWVAHHIPGFVWKYDQENAA